MREAKTWKPPESVRIGLSQPHEAVQAAEVADDVEPGPQEQVERVAEDDLGADAVELARRIALTEPYVPTGMNAGVSTVPRANVMRPRRAVPSVASRSNRIGR